MRVLITGGAGFIGSTLVKHLETASYEVFIIDDFSFGHRSFVDIPIDKIYDVDILNKEKVNHAFSIIQPSIVIHLAAIHFIPYCNLHPFESSNININGTINILNACRNLKSVVKVFFASTAAVYPVSDFPYTEDMEMCPMDIYGLSKIVGEHLCNEFYLETNIPTIICRFFNAFGPNETNPHLIPAIADQINAGKRIIELGNLEPKRDFIHTTDMARAIQLLIEKFNDGIDTFNLGRGIEYSVVDIVKAFDKALGVDLEIVSDPLRVRKVERLHLLADITKIKSYIGWEPRMSIEEGVATLIR